MNAFAQRRQSRTVPPDAHGARAWTTAERILAEREARTLDSERIRLDIGGHTYSVADLQRAASRESSDR